MLPAIRIRIAFTAALAWTVLGAAPARAQGEIPRELLVVVLPGAEEFTDREGDPPVIRGYGPDPVTGEETLLGYIFLTSDIPPEEFGYTAPIEVLVGMDPSGTITGARVTWYIESLRETDGDFLRTRGYQEQFAGKHIGDPFRVRRDVDGISGATISVGSMARGIRNAARRVAAAYLTPRGSQGTAAGGPGGITADALEDLSLPELLRRGFLERIVVLHQGRAAIEVTLGYVRDEASGEVLLGRRAFLQALEEAGSRAAEDHVLLLGLDGALWALFYPSTLWLVQDGDSLHVASADVVMLDEPRGGTLAGQFRSVGILLVDRRMDLARPFTVIVDRRPGMDLASREFAGFAAATVVPPAAGATGAGPARAEALAIPVEVLSVGGEPRVVSAVDLSALAENLALSGEAPAASPEDPTAAPESVAGGSPADGTETVTSERSRAGSPAPESIADPPTARARAAEVDPGAAPAGSAVGAPARPEGASSRDAPPDAAAGSDLAARAGAAANAPMANDAPGARVQAPNTPPDAILPFAYMEEETVLARTLATTSWPRVVRLLAVLALAAAAFAAKRTWLRWAALAVTFLLLGFFDRGFLSVSHISSAISVGPGVLLNDLPLLLIVAFTVVTTLLWGRVFCGYLCPFGALQDFLERVVPRRFQRELPYALHRQALWIKYAVLILVLAPAVAGIPLSLYQYFEPFGTVFFLGPSVLLWSIALALLAASAMVPRFYCRYVCPLGASLAVVSTLSPFRIRRVEQCEVCKVCEQNCPTGAIRGPDIDFKECVRCNICEVKLIERAGSCRHEMEEIRPRLVQLRVPAGGPHEP